MEPIDIKLFLEGFIIVTAIHVSLVNLIQYTQAKNWLGSHGIDPSYYKDKIRENRTINYYLGAPGRKLAYILYSKKKQKEI